MRRLRRVTAPPVLVAVLVAVLVSCSSGPAEQTAAAAEPALGPVPRITAYTQVTRPLDTYLPTVQQKLALQRVAAAAVNRCLRQRGVSGAVTEPPTLAAFVAGTARDRVVRSDLWGFYDTQNYRSFGYRRPPGTVDMIKVPRPSGPADVISQCLQAGRDVLRPLGPDGIDGLPDGGPPIPLTDSRYRQAVAAWSTCMREQGFPFGDPLAAQNEVQQRLDAPLTAKDRATAVSDVECKNSTNLVGVGTAVLTAYDRIYIAAHETQLAARRDQVDKVIRSGSGA